MAASAVAYVVGAFATEAATPLIISELYGAGTVMTVQTAISVGTVLGGVVGIVAGQLVKNAIVGQGSGPDSVSAAAAQGIMLNTSSTVEPIPVIYGTRKVGGTRALVHTSAGAANQNYANELMHIILVLGEGEVHAVDEVYLDDVPLITPLTAAAPSMTVTDGRFANRCYVEFFSGTDTQAACQLAQAYLPGVWTAQHRLAGVAYLYVQLKYEPSVFRGLPTITALVRGKKVYDPRNAATTFSNNPALCLRDYLTNARYGRGINSANIDDASFTVAANYCDESVSIPGNTQTRYTCDGVVNINNTAFDNVKALLGAMRGMLVFSAGIYRLVLDKPASSTFAFTEDNITGAWSISQPGRRSKLNRVTAGVYNPNTNWQPDFAIANSAAYRALDAGRLSEAKLDLPYTANLYRGQQLAGLHLKQSRFGIGVRFRALQEGLRAEVGDVVSITHSTPGWVAKLFRVMQIVLAADDEVEVSAQEYDASVYNLDTLAAVTGRASTTLPDVFTVGVPGTPTVLETLYSTTGSAGVKTRAGVSCAAATDIFVNGYSFEYRLSGASAWTVLPTVATPSTDVPDLAPAVYEFRVRAQNNVGVLGAYSATTTKELLGLTAPPTAVLAFAVTKVGGVAYGSWALTTDLDVRIGGKVVVRHSTQTSGATWNDGLILGEFNGDAIMGVLPLITGTYMAKFVDSTLNYSASVASFVVTEGLVTGYTTMATSTQAPSFTGSKTNLVVSASALQLDSGFLFDSAAGNFDSAAGNFDSMGSLSQTGTYLFDTYVDMVTVATRRLEAQVKMLASNTADLWDARLGNFDDAAGDVDGAAIDDCDVTLYHACTDTDPAASPTWTAWAPFFVADVTSRAIKFKLEYASGTNTHQIAVSTLTVKVKS